jgi:hypothetical protein
MPFCGPCLAACKWFVTSGKFICMHYLYCAKKICTDATTTTHARARTHTHTHVCVCVCVCVAVINLASFQLDIFEIKYDLLRKKMCMEVCRRDSILADTSPARAWSTWLSPAQYHNLSIPEPHTRQAPAQTPPLLEEPVEPQYERRAYADAHLHGTGGYPFK